MSLASKDQAGSLLSGGAQDLAGTEVLRRQPGGRWVYNLDNPL